MLLAYSAIVFVFIDGLCLVLVYGNGKGVVDFYFAVEVDTYRDDTLGD